MSSPEKFYFYRDGSYIDELPSELIPLLKNAGAIESESKSGSSVKAKRQSVSLCGILQNDEVVHVFLPKCHPEPGNDETSRRASARSLLHCIANYCEDKGSSFNALSEVGEVGDVERFPLYREIVQDYIRNGLFNSQDEVKRRGSSGKIDWKSTVAKVLPLVAKSGQVAYPYFITRKFSYNSTTIVADIHAAIVNEIDEHYGWWFTDSPSGRVAPELRGHSFSGADKAKLAALTRKELSSSFYDRHIRLLRNLIRYLESDPYSSAYGTEVRGVTKFDLVWEHMLNEVLRPTAKDLKASLPSPAYITNNEKSTLLKSKGGRIDTLLQEGDAIAVVDAKYYNAFSPKSAPGWPDLVKQFFYEKLIASTGKEYKIGNFFIMPRNQSINRPIQGIIAIEKDKEIETLESIFPPVNCLYICPKLLINNYNKKIRDLKLRSEIFSIIKKQED